jgi:hypothetical protein
MKLQGKIKTYTKGGRICEQKVPVEYNGHGVIRITEKDMPWAFFLRGVDLDDLLKHKEVHYEIGGIEPIDQGFPIDALNTDEVDHKYLIVSMK